MAIHELPTVTIDGKNKIFNGYIYNVSYQVGFSSEPSQMVVSLISEDGTYLEPDLGYDSAYTIKIGAQVYNMYAYESNLVEDNSGNILEVKFEDATSKFNQIFVGLRHKHGIQSSKCIIIVGQPIPLGEGSSQIDDCAKNEAVSETQATIDYVALERTTILEVQYNFTELIDEMSKIGIKIGKFKDKNPFYYNKYVGKLRDVLNSWCADFGYNYFYDHKEKSITFIDISDGIKIDFAEPSEDQLISKKTKRSLKGTAVKGSISYFAAEGQVRCLIDNGQKGFKADFTRVLNGRPITTDFVFPGGNLGVSPTHFSIACALSVYSESLRAAYFLYYIYNLHTLGNGILNLSIPEMGNMTIFKSVMATSLAAIDVATYNNLLNLLPPHIKGNPAYSADRLCFFVAYQDENLYQQQYTKEAQIARDIMGKYWFADYGITNIQVDKGPPQIVSEDSGAIYYDSKTTGEPIFIEVDGFNYLVNTGLTRFILVKREVAAWYPNDSELQVLSDRWAGYMPAALSSVDEDTSTAFQSYATIAVPDALQLKIYAVLLPPAAPTFALGGSSHPNEANPQLFRNGNGADYHYGVMDKGTVTINFDGTNLFLPIGTFGADLNQYKIIVDDSLGYLNTCKTLPKIESVYTSVECNKDVENLEINLLDISSLNLELYTYNAGAQACTPNLSKIAGIHTALNKNLTYNTPDQFEEITYTIGGLPENVPSIEEGLLNFDISINSEQGIISSITVGNSAAIAPSIDYALTKSQFSTNQSKVQYSKTLNYNKLSIDVS